MKPVIIALFLSCSTVGLRRGIPVVVLVLFFGSASVDSHASGLHALLLAFHK
jgi:hypothetical protein